MKIRKIAIAWMLLLVVTLSGCGAGNSLDGTWKGSYDVTDIVKEVYTPSLTASDAAMEEYIQFKALELGLTFTFADESMSISVDEEAKAALQSSIETALITSYNAYMEAKAAKADMKLEELYTVNRTTQEEAVADFLKGMKVDQVVDVVVAAFQISGSYAYDSEAITIVYEDDTWEKMKYAFEGGKLTITISNGEQEVPVVCEKAE